MLPHMLRCQSVEILQAIFRFEYHNDPIRNLHLSLNLAVDEVLRKPPRVSRLWTRSPLRKVSLHMVVFIEVADQLRLSIA